MEKASVQRKTFSVQFYLLCQNHKTQSKMFKLVRIPELKFFPLESEVQLVEPIGLKVNWLQLVASCVLAVASAGYIAQPAIIHAPVVHAVHAPVATSYQSSHVVHHSAPIVKA